MVNTKNISSHALVKLLIFSNIRWNIFGNHLKQVNILYFFPLHQMKDSISSVYLIDKVSLIKMLQLLFTNLFGETTRKRLISRRPKIHAPLGVPCVQWTEKNFILNVFSGHTQMAYEKMQACIHFTLRWQYINRRLKYLESKVANIVVIFLKAVSICPVPDI